MGAYPPDGADLSGAQLKAVTLHARNDGLADPAKVEDGLSRLPPGSSWW